MFFREEPQSVDNFKKEIFHFLAEERKELNVLRSQVQIAVLELTEISRRAHNLILGEALAKIIEKFNAV